MPLEPAQLQVLIVLAGVAQFAIAAASLGAPAVLEWRSELAQLRPLNRQIFSVYGGYILGTNLLLASLCAFAPAWLTDGSPLAAAVCGYVLLYWGARLVIQFVYYDRASAPQGALYDAAHWLFSLAFLYLTVVFGLLLASNL